MAMRSFAFKQQWGGECEIRFVKTSYVQDGTLAITVLSRERNSKFWEPYAKRTVNLCLPLDGNEAYIDEINVPDLCGFVIEKGWARNVGSGKSGWCTYPKVEFTDEFLREICEEGV